MTDLEMKVEALIGCVDPDTYARVLENVKSKLSRNRSYRTDTPSAQEVQKAARAVLTDIGMPAHIVGYRHCVTALRLLVEEPDLLRAVTKELYPAVAQIHRTSGQRVSRDILHAVECTWSRGDIGILERYWGSSVNPYMGRPTNREFLAKCAELLRERLGIEDT